MRRFRPRFVCFFGGLLFVCPAQANESIPVQVDPNVELLSIVFRLAGADEYNQPKSHSPYSDEVEKHFGPFKDHRAVKMAAQLRSDAGIGFDAVMSYATHLASRTLDPKFPFAQSEGSLEKRWSPASATRFLAALKQFAADSKADGFFAAHQDFYQKAAERLKAPLASRPFRAWLDGFFGAKPRTKFVATVGLLNGGASYGVSVHYPDGKEEILPVIGAGEFDAQGLPVFDDRAIPLIAHEFCHSYTNPFVDQFAGGLLPSAEKIFPYRKALLARQAYSTPTTMLYESMVRACTARFAMDNNTPAAAKAELARDVGRGFLWTGELAELLGSYEKKRIEYQSFEDFMPKVVTFFGSVADSIETRVGRLPKVVSISPANGDKSADPATKEIRVEFDRPMRTNSYAVMGDPTKTPPVAQSAGRAVPPRFLEGRKVFVMPVKLEPGKTYVYALNSVYRSGFVSAEGLPLDPVEVTFTTALR